MPIEGCTLLLVSFTLLVIYFSCTPSPRQRSDVCEWVQVPRKSIWVWLLEGAVVLPQHMVLSQAQPTTFQPRGGVRRECILSSR